MIPIGTVIRLPKPKPWVHIAIKGKVRLKIIRRNEMGVFGDDNLPRFPIYAEAWGQHSKHGYGEYLIGWRSWGWEWPE